jgi:hypothetical protein
VVPVVCAARLSLSPTLHQKRGWRAISTSLCWARKKKKKKLYFLILSYKSARAIYFGRLFEPNGRGGGGGKEEKIRSVPSSSSYSISYSLTHSVPSFHAGQVRLHFQSKPAFFFFLSDKTTATLILLLLLPLVIGI